MFILDSDYAAVIKADNLTAVIRDNPVLLDTSITAAIAEMQSYLAGRFDVGLIFSQTGNDRNPILVMYGCDISLYHLHAAFAPVKIPAIRVERYQAAIAWLKMVGRGEINPGLPANESSGNGANPGAAWGYSENSFYDF